MHSFKYSKTIWMFILSTAYGSKSPIGLTNLCVIDREFTSNSQISYAGQPSTDVYLSNNKSPLAAINLENQDKMVAESLNSNREPLSAPSIEADGDDVSLQASGADSPPEMYFNQVINHFNEVEGKETKGGDTFKQRFYFNNKFYQTSGPAFLYIGGEGELTNRAVTTGLMAKLARQNHGSMYALEHRYYGKSHPFPNLALSNLQFLSSKQALADIANFIRNKSKMEQRWILVGGSYAGNLSAWFRKLYPELAYGSLASSAPVQAKAEFYEYDLVVGKSLGPQCSKKLASVIEQLDQGMDTWPRSKINQVKEQFQCMDVNDDTLFLSVLSDMVATAVQYSRPNIPFNVQTVCNGFTDDLDFDKSIQHLADATKIYFKQYKRTCYQSTFLDEIKSEVIEETSASRQWTYQTCTEFGYYQTAPPKPYLSMRSRKLTYEWTYQISCSAQNYGQLVGPPPISATNEFYGGSKIAIPKVIYTNGGLDPWSYLSIKPSNNTLKENKEESLIRLIPSGSHTQDLLADLAQDEADMIQARKDIETEIQKWLEEP